MSARITSRAATCFASPAITLKLFESTGCTDVTCGADRWCHDFVSDGETHTYAASRDGWIVIVIDGATAFDTAGSYTLNVSLAGCLAAGCECTDVDAGPVSSDAGRDGGGSDAGPVWSIGICRVQRPTSALSAPGGVTRVYGRVYAAGLTTRTASTDVDPLLVGELGVGPHGVLPTMPGWTWTAATANLSYGPGSAGFEANNDEYESDLVASGAGSYDFAYRFSGDGGATWTYCDALAAGSSDGYQLANAGTLTVM